MNGRKEIWLRTRGYCLFVSLPPGGIEDLGRSNSFTDRWKDIVIGSATFREAKLDWEETSTPPTA